MISSKILVQSLSLLALSLPHAFVQAAGGYVDDLSLGEFYPYVVHPPAGDNPPENPPMHLFLHGAGSRGPPNDLDNRCQWNGPARRIREYNAGNKTTSSIMAAEQFLTVMPMAPNTTEAVPEWKLDHVLDVVNQVKTQYKFDSNRVYCSGYSMGARDMWKFIIDNPTLCTAVAISAGEPDNTTDYTSIINVPIRHYIGSKDFEGSSNLKVGNRTQNAIQAAGSTVCQMVVIPGPTPDPAHNSMADAPFYEDLFNWFLSHDASSANNTAPVPGIVTLDPVATGTATGNSIPTATSSGSSTATSTPSSPGATTGAQTSTGDHDSAAGNIMLPSWMPLAGLIIASFVTLF